MLCKAEQCSSFLPNTPNIYLKILQQNIRSLKCNIDGLLPIIISSNVSWDYIVLTECWLPSNPNIPHIEGYNHSATTNNLTQNEGVVVYYRRDLAVHIEEPDFHDANCLAIKPNKCTVMLAIYRPPGYRNINKFIESMNNILIKYSKIQNIIIVGDINIDITDSNKDINSNLYLDMLAFHGILPGHTLPTHNKTCLDHVLLKTRLAAYCLVLETTLTDHYSVALYFPTRQQLKPPNITNRINYESLTHELKKFDFSFLYTITDANIATDYFIKTLQTLVLSNSKQVNMSRRNRILKPWITPGVLRCIKNRDNLHKKVKKDPNNDSLQITFKRYRNFCCNLLKNLKRNYGKQQIQSAHKDNKKLWKAIKEITNTVKSKENATNLLRAENPKQAINSVNNFFANIGKSLAEKILVRNIPALPRKQIRNPKSFVLLSTDEDEVKTTLTNLKSDCAIGIDQIPADVLKINKDILSSPISYICNLCFSTGVIPTALKKSRIHPIHKAGNRDCVNNYRPISILSSLSKVIERLINKRLVKFLEDNKLISHAQYGFRSKMSTSDAVHELTNHIVNDIDNKKKTIAIFLDLAKAFDTVSVQILIEKLELMGIRGLQLKLFESYLSNRTQCVKIDNITSDEATIQYGVPQGSILGPTLFLAYINDLCQLGFQNGKIVTFADDTALLFSGDTWNEVFLYAQQGFNDVTRWLNENMLTLNVEKTKYIMFSLKTIEASNNIVNYKIISHSCDNFDGGGCTCPELQRTRSIKYLGIMIDDKLNFHCHIDMISARVRKLIAIFKNLRHVADKELIKSVYLALCQPQLFYCIDVWGGATKSHFLKIERAQRAILKVSHSLPFYHPTTDLYKQVRVLTVRQLFVLQTIIKKHSMISYEPEKLKSIRRKDRVCHIKKANTTFAKRFFCHQSNNLYNKLNRVLSIYPLTKNKCKQKVKEWLQNLDYNTTEDLLK